MWLIASTLLPVHEGESCFTTRFLTVPGASTNGGETQQRCMMVAHSQTYPPLWLVG